MPIISGIVASSKRGHVRPDAPTIDTATDVGTARAYNNGAATVAFTPAATGGAATSYTAVSSPGGFTATGASSPLTVAGLQSGVAYTFTVTATNAYGTSASSASSNLITATTVPQAPTIGTAADGGTGTTATVAFTANANGGKTVSTFTATSSPSSITGSSATSPITVSGLTTGTAYTFNVTATNANGTSTASAASNSVTPITPSSYESIATVTVGAGGSSSVSFSSIPSNYKHLQIRAFSQSNRATYGISEIRFQVNSDTAGNYMIHQLTGDGSTVTAGAIGPSTTYMMDTNGTIGTSTGGTFGATIIDFLEYANTNKNKTVRVLSGVDINGTIAGYGGRVGLFSGLWMNTSAITSIQLFAGVGTNFTQYTSFALYGVKG